MADRAGDSDQGDVSTPLAQDVPAWNPVARRTVGYRSRELGVGRGQTARGGFVKTRSVVYDAW